MNTGIDTILQIAMTSPIARYAWNNRGVAPRAYIKGMALVYARAYCKLKNKEPITVETAVASSGNAAHDALAFYEPEFHALGMDNSKDGPDTLRHLFVLLISLGMQESSGQYCEGRDKGANNTTGETAEAGLFQTSWNLRKCSDLLPKLFTQYSNSTDFLDIFRQGVACKNADPTNYGSGDGQEFQRLCKSCPPFAAEFAALGLRKDRSHWGPINHKAAEIKAECDSMLMTVQNAVDSDSLCSVVLAPMPSTNI
jgi:hypothetical protein